MSNQVLPVAVQDRPVACCPPMVRAPLGEEAAVGLSRMFKAMADPIRLRLLSMIASHAGGEACVCDLTGPFDVSQPTISHHLKVLREAGLVGSERRGTWVYYWIQPAALNQLSALLQAAPANSDATASGSNSGSGCCE
ncbi:ArsR family transcriptional regulator [Streptomyces sp. B3I7]|uniref:ArsR/SmtB family transcription factor n=1 Tax=Streptomyces sp. B3I7 TaxID=3042269 RepID=UPI00278122A3|nr:metalloregulator ArsR/SmtB family transcription factor [Streptomyces sp. B3I7]MDQ0808425.1 ArsR family transcriptional regulator [Streptomyces sp. B3I7]